MTGESSCVNLNSLPNKKTRSSERQKLLNYMRNLNNGKAESQQLRDLTKAGKQRNWRGKKIRNLKYAELLQDIGMPKSVRVKHCADKLIFKKTSNGRLKLHQAWFCKSRLCALCNWRRAMKHSNQVAKMLDTALETKPKARFLFITFTMKNVSAEELGKAILKLSQAFTKLMKCAKVARNLLGYMRVIEVTVNNENGTYHPHIHALVMVKASYFNSSANYIEQTEWLLFWQQAMKLDYMPVVDVRTIKPKGSASDTLASAKEVAKYPVKDTDYMSYDHRENMNRVIALENGLSGKRLVSYGLLFKEIRRKLKLEDVEADSDLIKTLDDDEEGETRGGEIVAIWNNVRKNYFLSQD